MSPGQADKTIRSGRMLWGFAAWVTLVSALAGRAGWSAQGMNASAAFLCLGAFALIARRRRPVSSNGKLLDALSAVLVAGPLLWWVVQALATQALAPFEASLLTTCCNLMLALLAGGNRGGRNWAWGIGVATCVAAGLYIDERLCVPVYVGTCLIGCLVLHGGRDRAIGGMIATCAVVMIATLAASALIGRDDHLSGRRGFVPASGGTGAGSELAMRGVGDGPDLIDATRDARSIGFDQSNVFVNSEQLGLYDAFVESFGDPLPPGETKKMIGLRQDQVIESGAAAGLDLRRGRPFSLRRTAPPSAPPLPGATEVLLWVDSDQSQHIRLRTYDRFDGEAWHEAPAATGKVSLHNVDDPVWMVPVEQPYGDLLADPVTTRITTGRYGDSVLPMPAFVTAFKLGRVNRKDFFAPAQSGFLRLHDRPVPAGSVLEVRHKLPDSRRRERVAPATSPKRRTVQLAAPVPERLKRLAETWTAHAPPGWPQLDAVLAGLGSEFRFDRAVAFSGGDPLDDFVGARAGTSYHFATAAAVILNDLGFEARAVSGFYANAERSDDRSGQIRVGPGDGHMWVELRLADGSWLPIEPTPGFRLAVAPLPLVARLSSAAAAHRASLGCAAALAFIGLVWRRRLLDMLWTLAWRARVTADPRNAPIHTVALLHRRAALAGVPRGAGQTVRQWLGRIYQGGAGPVISRFMDDVDRLLYSDIRPSAESRETSIGAARLLTRRIIARSTSCTQRS